MKVNNTVFNKVFLSFLQTYILTQRASSETTLLVHQKNNNVQQRNLFLRDKYFSCFNLFIFVWMKYRGYLKYD